MITHKSLFGKLRDDTAINRYEQYAHWTLPHLMADPRVIAANGRVVVERDFQEMGALLVNNLAAKLARILFPTEYSFFKIGTGPKLMQELQDRLGITDVGEVKSQLAMLELEAKDRFHANAGYAAINMIMKYLITVGNVLVYRDSKAGRTLFWGPHRFSIKRAEDTTMLDCVLREITTFEALSPTIQSALRLAQRSRYSRKETQVEKYTRIVREYRGEGEGYFVSEQVDETPVGEGTWYPKLLCPWFAPTWSIIPGEHLGRSLVEDFAGGFAKLSSMSEAAALYGVEMSRVLNLVSQAGGASIDDLRAAPQGGFVRGDKESVTAYEAGDARKLEVLMNSIEPTVRNLAQAFMYTGSTRDAERVTAFELRQQALEAENTLGGNVSTLSEGLQTPMARLTLAEVSPAATVGVALQKLNPEITTGLAAMGRSSTVQNLLFAAQEAAGIITLAQLDKRIDPARIVDTVFAGRSVDSKALMYTPEQQRANAEAANAEQAAAAAMAQAQVLQKSGDQIAQALG